LFGPNGFLKIQSIWDGERLITFTFLEGSDVMWFSILNREITFEKWDSENELKNYLRRFNTDYIILGEESYPHSYYSIKIRSVIQDESFCIGLLPAISGLTASILLLPEHERILIGYNKQIAGFGLDQLKLLFEIELDSAFHSFVQIPDKGVILALQEVDIARIDPDGNILWSSGGDLIQSTRIDGDEIHVSFLDIPPAIYNIYTGVSMLDK
jgi:hypothetical protein